MLTDKCRAEAYCTRYSRVLPRSPAPACAWCCLRSKFPPWDLTALNPRGYCRSSRGDDRTTGVSPLSSVFRPAPAMRVLECPPLWRPPRPVSAQAGRGGVSPRQLAADDARARIPPARARSTVQAPVVIRREPGGQMRMQASAFAAFVDFLIRELCLLKCAYYAGSQQLRYSSFRPADLSHLYAYYPRLAAVITVRFAPTLPDDHARLFPSLQAPSFLDLDSELIP